MNRIREKVIQAQKEKKKLFVPFLTAGYPAKKHTVPLLLAAARAGADIIEIGVPFSDPIADGPTIQESSFEALQNGTTLSDIFSFVREVRNHSDVALLLFTYFNPVFHYGVEKFIVDAKNAGADGLLVPDLSPDEATGVVQAAKKHDMSIVFLVAPTTTETRIRLIEKYSTDFIYVVSVTGTTGARASLSAKVEPFLRKMRNTLRKPFVVGFGISTPDDVKNISRLSDGVVVGSALINYIKEQGDTDDLCGRAETFLKELKSPLDSAAT